MQPKHLILLVLFLASTTYYYQITGAVINTETSKITRIIDGDTLQLDNDQKIRLLGINTPEKKRLLYQEAKELLINLVANKTVQIESHGIDKYGRTLGYIFLDDKNINAEILSRGLATLYYYDHDNHYEELKQSEEFARLNNLGLWKKSPNSRCIKITQFKTNEPESLTLQNTCNIQLDITYKDDASHIYETMMKPNSQYTKSFSHIWNTDGDTIYIYDNQGLLLFQRY